MAKKIKKRRADAPWVPPKKSRAENAAAKQAARSRLQGKLAAIYARTAAGRAERDAVIAGADMRDVDHLPVMTSPTKVTTPGIRTKHAIDTTPLPRFEVRDPLAGVADELGALADDAKKSAAAIGAVLETARELKPRKRKRKRKFRRDEDGTLGDQLDTVKREAITNALIAERGNISGAAARLGLHRQSLHRIMSDLGITRPTSEAA